MVDLIVIGGGPGGYAAAEFAARRGMAVALVERERLGGTCLHRGCVPTKAYLHEADTAHAAQAMWPGAALLVDRAAMLARKNATVDTLEKGVAALLRAGKVAVYAGQGTLVSAAAPFQVTVQGADGATQTLEGRRVLLAAGSTPARIPVPGCDDTAVWTSDELLAEAGAEPFQSLLIVGGGVIGVEMAEVYARLGVTVTLLEAEKRILPMMDMELSRSAEALLRALGVQAHTDARLTGIARGGRGFIARWEKGGQAAEAEVERVLLATGRTPASNGLFGPDVTIAMNRRAVAVDERYRTSLPGVYAIGDLNGLQPLAHAAHAQGLVAVCDMLGVPAPVDAALVPSCVYTAPEIASVGLGEAEAKAQGHAVAVGKALTTQTARTLIEGLGRGFVKLVFDQESRVLLGAQLFCGNATDMVGELGLAIVNGMTAAQLMRAVRPHPTFEEAITDAVMASGLV